MGIAYVYPTWLNHVIEDWFLLRSGQEPGQMTKEAVDHAAVWEEWTVCGLRG